jgi:two-component system, LytTR family, sensor kinase
LNHFLLEPDAEQETDRARSGIPTRWARVLLVGVFCAALAAVSITAQTYLSMLNHGHSFWRILLWQMSGWSLWALLAPTVLKIGGSLSAPGPARARRWLAVAASGLVCIALHLAITAQLTVWFQPLVPVVTYGYRQAFAVQFGSQLVGDLLAYTMLILVGSAMAVSDRARQLALRESRLEAELARAHLEALRLEIQPHFLFNTLNSLAALIRLKANDKALEMLLSLSELMRSTLERSGEHVLAVSAEVEFTKRYVDLQRARFSDRLDVVYAVDADCHDLAIPAFLLQPLIENAVRHGMSPRAGRCRVEVGARLEQGQLRVWVADDGAGLPADFDVSRAAGTGLTNIRRRLEQLYGPSAALTIRAGARSGTVVNVTVPGRSADPPSRATA